MTREFLGTAAALKGTFERYFLPEAEIISKKMTDFFNVQYLYQYL